MARLSQQSTLRVRHAADRPALFGRRAGRDRVLTCLAVNGPLHAREIARLIQSDPHKTFDMVERLREVGLVVKRDQPGFRKIVMLDKALGTLYFQLRELLAALDARWPIEKSGRPRPFYAKTALRGAAALDDARVERWFHSVPRSRTLLYVAAVGRTNMTDLVRRAGLGSVSALYAVNFWERQGVLRSRTAGRHRVVELDESFAVAEPLWHVLNALVSRSATYTEHRLRAVETGPYTEGRRA